MAFETLIDARTLQSLLGEHPPVIVDCRFDLADAQAGRRAYLAAHIPTARYADLNRDLSSPIGPATGRHPLPSPEDFALTLSRWGVSGGSQVVAYDAVNGSLAARLWWLLRFVGHRSVAVLDGGLQAWLAAGGRVLAGEETPPARTSYAVPARLRPDATVEAAELLAALATPTYLLIDARAPERYAGKLEPIDALAGHVPGAVNHPFSANLAPDGTFLPAEELRRRWRERLGKRAATAVVAMCGSGVTACHNLLSLEIAGLPGGKLYPGSWSEWIRDATRPVARGEDP